MPHAESHMHLQDLAFYAFPTLEQLQEATDDGLRAEGFGYRCCSHCLLQHLDTILGPQIVEKGNWVLRQSRGLVLFPLSWADTCC